TPVLPRQRVKDTRAALVEHFKEGHFVHPAALFAPDPAKLADWLTSGASAADDADDSDEADEGIDGSPDDASDQDVGAFREAAE
ncbi:MAG: plasmid partitioning protein, partial [Bosea sp. (in: a-proteobacteria)]|nr:plasmid partitioning protein [Bosea sp. (in: a-proteobacteria)]